MQILSLHGVTAGSKSKSALLDDMLGLCLFHPQRMGSCSSQVPRAITKVAKCHRDFAYYGMCTWVRVVCWAST